MFQKDGKFRTRSGRTVTVKEDGGLIFDHANGYLSTETAMDAEEFFQAKHDNEIGRWRCAADPEYVVYPDALRVHGARSGIRVWNERTGVSRHYANVEGVDGLGGYFDEAARAYFEAHPERKPWHDAKPGQVWALTVDGAESAFYPSKSLARAFTPVAPETGRTAVSMDSFEITDGRKIWPKDAS